MLPVIARRLQHQPMTIDRECRERCIPCSVRLPSLVDRIQDCTVRIMLACSDKAVEAVSSSVYETNLRLVLEILLG